MVGRSRDSVLSAGRGLLLLLAGATFAATPARAASPRLELRDLAGRPVVAEVAPGESALVLHFFASWCGACAEELPALADAAARCATGRVRVAAVNVAEDAATAERFLRAHAPGLTLWLDAEGDGWRQAGLRGLPADLLLRADGGSERIEGPLDAAAWRARLDTLGCRAPAPPDPRDGSSAP